jgi:hypothetical protein
MTSPAALPTISSLQTAKTASFRRLKVAHRRVIALHIRGIPSAEIDTILGRGQGYAGSVLRNPAVQPILDAIYRDYDNELRALYPLTIKRMRGILEEGSDSDALRATELWHKIHGTMDRVKDERATAEDVIEQILEKIMPDGSVMRITKRRRFFSTQDDIDDGQILDAPSNDEPTDILLSSCGDGDVDELPRGDTGESGG